MNNGHGLSASLELNPEVLLNTGQCSGLVRVCDLVQIPHIAWAFGFLTGCCALFLIIISQVDVGDQAEVNFALSQYGPLLLKQLINIT